ncbi:hypothetical protein L7F22_012318 [Adiantum nelumboides]|nr:hypothetical protein [Adiantum nelumboides]
MRQVNELVQESMVDLAHLHLFTHSISTKERCETSTLVREQANCDPEGDSLLLKKLIRKGIPSTLRPKVWLVVSGAAKKRSAAPDSYFQDLCVAGHGRTSAAIKQIDHDLARTFPSHPWLDSPEGQASLKHVLVAYSLRDSHVGYCQVSSATIFCLLFSFFLVHQVVL